MLEAPRRRGNVPREIFAAALILVDEFVITVELLRNLNLGLTPDREMGLVASSWIWRVFIGEFLPGSSSCG